ncbi:toxin-antitoxin system protein [Phocaeicola sp.]
MEAIIRKQASFRLREDLLQILQREARKSNRSLNNFVESTLMDAMYPEPNEDTLAAVNEARSGKSAGTIDMGNFESFMKSVNDIE